MFYGRFGFAIAVSCERRPGEASNAGDPGSLLNETARFEIETVSGSGIRIGVVLSSDGRAVQSECSGSPTRPAPPLGWGRWVGDLWRKERFPRAIRRTSWPGTASSSAGSRGVDAAKSCHKG